MPRRPRDLLLAAALTTAAAITVWLATFSQTRIRWLDAVVLDGFMGLSRGRATEVFRSVGELGDPTPFALIGGALMAIALLRGRARIGLLAIPVILLASNVTTQILKPLLAQPRFSEWLGDGQIDAASWPSGHATGAMSLALCAVIAAGPRLRPVAAVAGGLFAVAVGYSILSMGWHYPSDVLGGYLVAATWTLLVLAGLRAADQVWPAASRRAEPPSLRATFAPAVLGLLAAAAVAAWVVLLRFEAAVAYAEANTWFVLAAAVLGAVGLALALALALRRPVPADPAPPTGSGRAPRAAPPLRSRRARG
jgi:membrane-associated phospholipid phosphatase